MPNGDFTSGLTDWTAINDVTVNASGEALLGEGTGAEQAAVLYQATSSQSGRLMLDVRAILSDVTVPPPGSPFGLPDAFAASLYFVDDLTQFSLDPTGLYFDDFLALFDYDSAGAVVHTGTTSQSPDKGAGWLRYTVNYATSFNWTVVSFELFDNNAQNDSQVFIDNVSVAAVPAPGGFALSAIGLLLLGAGQRMAAQRQRG